MQGIYDFRNVSYLGFPSQDAKAVVFPVAGCRGSFCKQGQRAKICAPGHVRGNSANFKKLVDRVFPRAPAGREMSGETRKVKIDYLKRGAFAHALQRLPGKKLQVARDVQHLGNLRVFLNIR